MFKAETTQQLLSLTKAEFRTWFKPLAEKAEYTLEEFSKLILAGAVLNGKYLPQEQTALLLQELLQQPVPAVIAIVDRRYVAWCGRTGYLDLQKAEDVQTLPSQPVESIAVHIATLVEYKQQLYSSIVKQASHVE